MVASSKLAKALVRRLSADEDDDDDVLESKPAQAWARIVGHLQNMEHREALLDLLNGDAYSKLGVSPKTPLDIGRVPCSSAGDEAASIRRVLNFESAAAEGGPELSAATFEHSIPTVQITPAEAQLDNLSEATVRRLADAKDALAATCERASEKGSEAGPSAEEESCRAGDNDAGEESDDLRGLWPHHLDEWPHPRYRGECCSPVPEDAESDPIELVIDGERIWLGPVEEELEEDEGLDTQEIAAAEEASQPESWAPSNPEDAAPPPSEPPHLPEAEEVRLQLGNQPQAPVLPSSPPPPPPPTSFPPPSSLPSRPVPADDVGEAAEAEAEEDAMADEAEAPIEEYADDDLDDIDDDAAVEIEVEIEIKEVRAAEETTTSWAAAAGPATAARAALAPQPASEPRPSSFHAGWRLP